MNTTSPPTSPPPPHAASTARPRAPRLPSSPRLLNPEAYPAVWQAMMTLQQAANQTTLEPALLELVKTRASQINRCAFCLDMHHRVAESQGEWPDRLYLLSAWEELPDLYTPREAAALRWTEALTRLSEGPVSDATFAEVSAHFTSAELLQLTLGIVAINGWNRFNVAYRIPPAARAQA